MRIDSLKNSPDRAGRYWVTFEDGTKLGLYRQTVEDFGLYIGKELTEEEKTQLLTAAGKMSAKMRAVRSVSATSVSKRDLEERLVRKGEDPEQAKEAVAWMEELHLVDDRNTAEALVHSCIARARVSSGQSRPSMKNGFPNSIGMRPLRTIRIRVRKLKNFSGAVWMLIPIRSR